MISLFLGKLDISGVNWSSQEAIRKHYFVISGKVMLTSSFSKHSAIVLFNA